MNFIRNSVTQNPFAQAPVTGRGFVVASLLAAAYGAQFAVAIASQRPSEPVVVAQAQPASNWGLQIRGLSKAQLAAERELGHAIAQQGNEALRQILAQARPQLLVNLPKPVAEPFDVASR